MSITSVRLQPDLEPGLEKLAKRLQRSKNWLINQAIRDYVDRNRQEAERWEETLIALESVREGREFSEEEVDTWLQSWGKKNEKQPPEK